MPGENKPTIILAALTLLLAALACGPSTEPAATPDLGVPTLAVSQTPASPTPTVPPGAPAATLPPPPVIQTTPPSGDAVATVVPTVGAETPEPGYRVVYVMDDDVLNVRDGAGVEHDIIGALAPRQGAVAITGPGTMVAGSRWVPIEAGDTRGWVNSHFLTSPIDSETFCRESDFMAIVDRLEEAIARRDGPALAALIQPERSLRLHMSWWNPAVRVDREAARTLFTSSDIYDWGIEDGSGRPIRGSFATVMLPLLDRNLLGASETACNEILNGGSAGFIRLPEGYDGVNYYSHYRPAAAADNTLDWGTWVVGIESWQGRYSLAFLVLYRWEI